MPERAVPEGRRRVAIENVQPEVDDGRFPIKRTVGEPVVVEARVFAEGHDVITCCVLYRSEEATDWEEVPMEPLGNDRWRAQFAVEKMGRYFYTVEGWIDPFQSWRRDLKKKIAAGQDVSVDLLVGAQMLTETAERKGGDRVLEGLAQSLASNEPLAERQRLAVDEELERLMARNPDRRFASRYVRELAVVVDREKARFSTWYELFPRSASPEPGRHGTFEDVERRLSYVADMGFDVLYLPPVHPIGRKHRKGKNNAEKAAPGDVGSPWAIGAEEGGHTAIHPDLGTLEDFRRLVKKADEHGLEIAMDLALQCAPDHPWVEEHPEWFKLRPDGTIQYAENPPKKYQDIVPLNFESDAWQELWNAVEEVVRFWIEQGIRVFRVDNPHTKPLPFWEWLIGSIKKDHPEVIFLSEAFTRPSVVYRLAKLGFTQSYNYFPWRNTKWELTTYFTELTRPPVCEFFRANLWPNTPDILTEHLQYGGRPAFVQRLVLAATLGASYGIYGPAFELCEHVAREPGSEEYLDSEKYQLRHWDLDREDSIRDIVKVVNAARHLNPALQSDRYLRFHIVNNEQILCFSKRTADRSNVVLVVVNLDPHFTQSGWLELDLAELGLDEERPFQAQDFLTAAHFLWHGTRSYVELDPQSSPAHILRIRRHLRSEQDFDYFM